MAFTHQTLPSGSNQGLYYDINTTHDLKQVELTTNKLDFRCLLYIYLGLCATICSQTYNTDVRYRKLLLNSDEFRRTFKVIEN